MDLIQDDKNPLENRFENRSTFLDQWNYCHQTVPYHVYVEGSNHHLDHVSGRMCRLTTVLRHAPPTIRERMSCQSDDDVSYYKTMVEQMPKVDPMNKRTLYVSVEHMCELGLGTRTQREILCDNLIHRACMRNELMMVNPVYALGALKDDNAILFLGSYNETESALVIVHKEPGRSWEWCIEVACSHVKDLGGDRASIRHDDVCL